MKIKTTLRYCNIPIWMVKIQNIDNLLCWWGWRLTGALIYHWFSSVQFSHTVVSNSLRPHEPQHTRPPCPSPTPRVYSNSSPLSRWCHPIILSSVIPSPPTFNLYQHQGLFKWVSSSHQVAKVLVFSLQHQSSQWTPRTDLLKDGLVGSPCSPRDSQESSSAPQFKSINTSALSFLYSPNHIHTWALEKP